MVGLGWARKHQYGVDMTLHDLLETIRAKFPEAKGSKAKGRQPIPGSYLAPILSTVHNTVIFQIGQQYGISDDAAAARLDAGEDIGVYLGAAPDAAIVRAREIAGHQRPGNAANLVRMGLRIAIPGHFHQAGSKGGVASVPDSYRDLQQELARQYAAHKPSTRRSQCTNLQAFARAMWLAGYIDPSMVPSDRREVLQVLELAGMGFSYAQNAINTYNRAAKGLNKSGDKLPIVSQRLDARLVGLRALPPHAFKGVTDPTQLRTDVLLQAITPEIARKFKLYAASAVGRREKRRLLSSKLNAVARIVAVLWGMRTVLERARFAAGCDNMPVPRTIEDVHLLHLYLLEVPVAVESSGSREGDSTDADELRRLGIAPVDEVYLPLMRVLIDAIAKEHRTSPNTAARSDQPYQPSTKGILNAATRVLRVTSLNVEQYPQMLPASTLANRVHRELYRHVAARNESAVKAGTARATTKNKSNLVSVITLPHLVCIGLPWLAAEVRRLEEAHSAVKTRVALSRSDPSNHPAVKDARDTWYTALESYVMLAVFTADPMRLSNLASARIGSGSHGQIRMNVAFDAAGMPVRIKGVTSYFAHAQATSAAGENIEAKLKQHGKERIWRWPPAVIDMQLLLAYMTGPRRDRIIDRKLLHVDGGAPVTGDTYSLARELDAGTLTLFISPGNPHKRENALAYSGGYVGQSIVSAEVGKGMHRVATEILGHSDVPAFDEHDPTWAGLFTGHNVRLLWTTYFFGLREDDPIRIRDDDSRFTSGRSIAMAATSDDERTLRKEYMAVSAAMLDRLRDPAAEWTHPHAHNAWMDRIYQMEVIDWATESVPRPPHLTELGGFRVTPPARPASVRRPRVRR